MSKNELCPQCGEECVNFYESVCEECCYNNQLELDTHNLQYDRWNNLTHDEINFEINKRYK